MFTVSQIFDMLGLLGSVVISAKIIIQQLFQEKVSKECELSENFKQKWIELCNDLHALNQVKFPRHVVSIILEWNFTVLPTFAIGQSGSFVEEYKNLYSTKQVSKYNQLLSLNSFMNSAELIIVGGR